MPGKGKIAAGFSLILLVICSQCFSRSNQPRVIYGRIMPAVSGRTLTGREVDLPAAAGGKPAVVIFTFSRAAGRDAENWAQRLSIREPRVPVYTVIFLESVPRLIRGMVVSGIKSEMPPAMQDRAIILFHDEESWKEQLQVSNDGHACVTLIGADGVVQWVNSESFTDFRFSALTKEIEALK